MKYINLILFLILPFLTWGQASGDFKFDDSSVTFPDGSVQITAATDNSEAESSIPPDYLISRIRASFTGINGPAIEVGFTNHLIITGLDFSIDTDNTHGYVITPGVMKFTKANGIASVDLLSRMKNNIAIAEVNFIVLTINSSGQLTASHEFILSNAKVVKVENKIRYTETKGYFFEETFTLSFSDIDIRNTLSNTETESFNVPR